MQISKLKEKILKMLGAIMMGAAIGFGFARQKANPPKVKIQGEEEE
jgi:hypothetical protein